MVRIAQSQTKYLREEILELLQFPPIKLPKLSGYAIRCWGYRGSIISHLKLANPTSSCIQSSTHNQEIFGNHLPQPSKSICYKSYGNTPELPQPSKIFALTWHADVGYIMHMVPCIAYFIHQICQLLSLDMLCVNAICLVYSSFM